MTRRDGTVAVAAGHRTKHSMLRGVATLTIVMLLACAAPEPSPGPMLPRWTAQNTLVALLDTERTRMTSLAPNSLRPLSDAEVLSAADALATLMRGSLDGVPALESLGYVAYEFRSSAGKRYVLFHEPGGPKFRALGLILVNRAPQRHVAVHAKHVGSDAGSHLTSRRIFDELAAVMLVWNGVLRCNSTEASPCRSDASVCGPYRAISDGNAYHRNLFNAGTLAAVASGAIVLDVHSNGVEPRQLLLSHGRAPDVEARTMLANRLRDRLVAESTGFTTGSCHHPDDPRDQFTMCAADAVQQKAANGLTHQESCSPDLIPPKVTGSLLQLEMRGTVYNTSSNVTRVIRALQAEIPLR
jgi:hypothetical protein